MGEETNEPGTERIYFAENGISRTPGVAVKQGTPNAFVEIAEGIELKMNSFQFSCRFIL